MARIFQKLYGVFFAGIGEIRVEQPRSGLGSITIATATATTATTVVATTAATAAAVTTATTTASATTAAAVTTAAATATTAAESTATATGSGFARFGFIDRQTTALEFTIVQRFDSRKGLFVAVHFNKAESTASSGLAVFENLCGDDAPILGEQLVEVRTCGTERQVANV
jgi:sulfite reductase alpha subunit-like flavoprotein